MSPTTKDFLGGVCTACDQLETEITQEKLADLLGVQTTRLSGVLRRLERFNVLATMPEMGKRPVYFKTLVNVEQAYKEGKLAGLFGPRGDSPKQRDKTEEAESECHNGIRTLKLYKTPKPTPMEELTEKFIELPTLLQSMMEMVVDLLIEPEMEIMNLIERRNLRVQNLEVLLDKQKIELSNSRAKMEELMTKLNRLSAQKNRVIPETKVVYR